MLTMAHTQYACHRRNTGKLRIAEPLAFIQRNRPLYENN